MWFSPNLLMISIQFVGSRTQPCRVFDLRPLPYLEHCMTRSNVFSRVFSRFHLFDSNPNWFVALFASGYDWPE